MTIEPPRPPADPVTSATRPASPAVMRNSPPPGRRGTTSAWPSTKSKYLLILALGPMQGQSCIQDAGRRRCAHGDGHMKTEEQLEALRRMLRIRKFEEAALD